MNDQIHPSYREVRPMEAIDQALFNFSPKIGLAVAVMVGFLVFAVSDFRFGGAVSTDRCNTCIKSFCWRLEPQRFAWPLV